MQSKVLKKMNMLETHRVKLRDFTSADTIVTQNCLQPLPDSWFGFGLFLGGMEIKIRASALSDRYR